MTQTKTASRLDRAVERYEKAIAAIEMAAKNLSKDLSVELVLDVLTARNAVQAALEYKSQPNPGRLIRAVKELDARLKQQTNYINQFTKLAEWQAILNPPEKEWWWLLDPITPKPWRDRFDWLWRFFSLILLTASLAFFADISTRVLSGGPDIAGVFGVIISTVLTLLAGQGALTQNGREGIEYVLTSLKWDKSLWDELICLAAGLLLGILILCWFSMPRIADNYINLGKQAYDAGQLTLAENNYNRAIKLNPENTEVYEKLGDLYQELPDYNKAIENYKIAWNGNHLKAADELASLYLKQQNYNQADEWLELALEPQRILLTKDKPYEISPKEFKILTRSGVLNQQESGRVKNLRSLDARKFAVIKDRATLNDKQFEVLIGLADFYLKKKQYSDSDRRLFLGFALAKNDKNKQGTIRAYQGWIQLEQKRYSDAETQLRDAIFLNNKLASAHCLLAQVSEKQNKQDDAKKSWEQCLQYASQYNQNENKWISLAIQGLNSKGKAQ
ncbi:tetratricopeptide repeat protein [Microcoleus sp. ARI1-B5]|uniref:tetratricopeptide repeat protein n=1 Tax=unclassified Microcoleus TaxID=2642155 RepID=UPI002FD4870F